MGSKYAPAGVDALKLPREKAIDDVREASGEQEDDGAAVMIVQNVGGDERSENQARKSEQVREIEQDERRCLLSRGSAYDTNACATRVAS